MASLKLTNETPVTMHLLLYACFCLPQPHIICPKTQPGALSPPCDCSTHRPCVNNKNCLLLLHPVARTWFLGEGLQVLKTPSGGLSRQPCARVFSPTLQSFWTVLTESKAFGKAPCMCKRDLGEPIRYKHIPKGVYILPQTYMFESAVLTMPEKWNLSFDEEIM